MHRRLDRRPTGLYTWLESYRKQKRGKNVSHSGVRAATKKSPRNFDSRFDLDFKTIHVSQNITRECPGNSSVSLQSGVVALLKVGSSRNCSACLHGLAVPCLTIREVQKLCTRQLLCQRNDERPGAHGVSAAARLARFSLLHCTAVFCLSPLLL